MKEELEERNVNNRNLIEELADNDRTIQDLRRAVSFRSGVKGESYSMKGDWLLLEKAKRRHLFFYAHKKGYFEKCKEGCQGWV